MPVITVSGFHGVGKSVLAKHIAKELGLRYISAGQIFRQEALRRGFSVEEFSVVASMNPEIDKAIDMRMLEEAKKGDVVIDALLAGWFVREYADLKIWLHAPLEVRVRRIVEREGRGYEEVLRETIIRESLERERFFRYYGINIDDLRIYDIVLNTEGLSLEDLLEIGLYLVKRMLRRKY